MVVFAFFVMTLRPDVGGTEDSPKFQFVGAALGTAHSPGYPFYVMATYAFTRIPLGTLAYRVNLFSAVCGTLACLCVFFTARRLGVTRLLSLAAAFGAASSYPLWSNSVTAEVYSLGAFLSAASILLVIAFVQTGEVWRLYAACAAWACGFGNHLTIAGILPAALVYGVVKDRRVLQPRIAITAAIIGILGVLQYGFIALRTFQGAPYLEARATTIQGVFDVIIARDVSWARFYQAQSTVAQIEVPMLLNGLRIHMGNLPIALVIVAIIIGIRRRNAEVMVVLGAAAGTLAFIANLWGDVVGFITPVCVQLWPLAALGLQMLVTLASPSPRALTVAGTLAMALPIVQGVRLWPSIDALRQPGDGPGVRVLYASLPMKSALVAENYWLARLVNYMHFSGEVSPDPNPRVLDNDPNDVRDALADGLQVYSFEGATQWLEAQGFHFERATIARQPFMSWLAMQQKGTMLVAASAGRALPYEWLPPSARSQRPSNYAVVIHVAGQAGVSIDHSDAAVTVTRPVADGRTLSMTATDDGPRIVLGDDVLAAADRGMSVAALSPDGQVIGRWVFDADETPGIELPPYAYALQPRTAACAILRPEQATDVTAVLDGGGWLASLEGFGKGAIALEMSSQASKPSSPQARKPPDPQALSPSAAWRHWLSHGRGLAGIEASALTFDGYRGTRPVFTLLVPPRPQRAIATLHSSEVTAVTVCGTIVPPLPASGAFDVTADRDGWYGAGWHLGERGGAQHFRWSSRVSTLRWQMDRAKAVRFLLRMRPASDKGASIQASINGRAAAGCTLAPGAWTDCRIDLPESGLQPGINELTLTSDTMAAPPDHPGDARELAFVLQPSRVR